VPAREEEEVKPWCQHPDRDQPKLTFRKKIEQSPTNDLERLSGEIKGSLAAIQGQLEGRNDGDEEWRQRASMARGFIAERQAILRSEIHSRNDRAKFTKSSAKTKLIAEAKQCLSNGDVSGAVAVLIEIADGAYTRSIHEPEIIVMNRKTR
jgi:hypothetical protein